VSDTSIECPLVNAYAEIDRLRKENQQLFNALRMLVEVKELLERCRVDPENRLYMLDISLRYRNAWNNVRKLIGATTE
jgi:hypothetical protein